MTSSWRSEPPTDGISTVHELTTAERATLNWIHRLATLNRANVTPDSEAAHWRHTSVAEMLLEHGRLFTPSPPDSTPGLPKACYRNATERASTHPDIYVEGLASTTAVPGLAIEHAWCATDNRAVDPTWSDGAAYIGIPLTDAFREHRQDRTGQWTLLWSRAVMDLLRDGLPPSALADVGRPIPTELRQRP
jgi:hypothetical protein